MLPHQQTPPADPPGVLKQRYVNAASLLAWGAYAALVYVVLVRGLQLARDTAFPLTIGKIAWADINPPIQLWFPLFPVAFALALLLPLATKYCIAFIVSIKGKDALSRWAKGILIVITGACIVSTLTATGPLMIESYSGKYREAAVKGELVEARLKAEKQIYADMQQSLQTMKEGKSVEAAAAREGVAGWSAKVAIAKKQLEAGQLDQARFDRIERASSSAAAREDLERQMREQQVKIASLPTASTAVTMVKSDESHGAQEFAEVSSAYWPMISFFALEMIAVFFGLIQLVLELTRDRQLADWEAVNAAPVPEAGIDTLAIEDQTDQWQVQPQDIQYDEHGNELVKVRRKKEEYYRRKSAPKKPKKDDPRAAQMFDGLSEGEQNPLSEVSDGRIVDNPDERALGDSGISAWDGVRGGEVHPVAAATGDLGRHAERDNQANGLGADGFDGGLEGRPDDAHSGWQSAGSDEIERDDPANAGSLTHDEEDQQADEPLDGEVSSEEGTSSDDDYLRAGAANDLLVGGERPDELGTDRILGGDDDGQFASGDSADADAGSEAELTETRLPDGEGVVVWDDETDPTIKELLRKTEAAE